MDRNSQHRFRAVVVGVSSGGVDALKQVIGSLPAGFPLPVLVVAHISPEADNGLALLLDELSAIRVKEADELEKAAAGTVYLAPPNYHLLVEKDATLSLSVDPPVRFARPSVDVLFGSAADAFGPALIGVVMTGAGCDGSWGLGRIKDAGGVTVVQDPADAVADSMPRSAVEAVGPDHIVPLERIAPLLVRLATS
ncbi:CheB methylesterase [Geobacter metallireducens RCH3]|uniref:protein-glutamate methylesterase n=1 Tax=Geobacter metallireducens (strain ATCC 53774 / DSM 7210 / GS-15) TaxID=269799 RepID=Q39SB5_GEOMG|nr:chemotaxis protein CheB [Geobacter metallireducens]ABB32859.1 protein glutamate methylesterase CheB [Geobacter metallireducens GS-15]EHP89008.1 CheB methylesterase [Geobacter metallireducens RCH3]